MSYARASLFNPYLTEIKMFEQKFDKKEAAVLTFLEENYQEIIAELNKLLENPIFKDLGTLTSFNMDDANMTAFRVYFQEMKMFSTDRLAQYIQASKIMLPRDQSKWLKDFEPYEKFVQKISNQLHESCMATFRDDEGGPSKSALIQATAGLSRTLLSLGRELRSLHEAYKNIVRQETIDQLANIKLHTPVAVIDKDTASTKSNTKGWF